MTKWVAKALAKRVLRQPLPRSKSTHDIEIRMRLIQKMAALYFPSSLTEIGAGWDACSAICWHRLGVREQHLVDIKSQLRVKEVNVILDHFDLEPISSIPDLEKLGVYYHAPARLSDTPSTDVVISNSVLEHIPEPELPSLLSCRRAIHNVDYKDHYSNFDSSITPYNFLSFSERTWKLFNPPAHYQNRLRHRDYVRLFEKLGFDIECDVKQPENAMDMLNTVHIHPEISSKYTTEDLLPTGALFYLSRA